MLKHRWYKTVKKVAKRVPVVLHLIHQVSHKGLLKNGGRGRKFLIELEAKSNGSQDLRHRWVGVQAGKEQSDAGRTTARCQVFF
jgi:hypothetical protein